MRHHHRQFVDRNPLAHGYVDDLAVQLARTGGGQKIGMNRIVNEREIARLLAVAVDYRGAIARHAPWRRRR